MKRLFTHILAFALGAVAVILWSQNTKLGDSLKSNQTRSEMTGVMIDGRPVDRLSVRSKDDRPNKNPSIEIAISKSIGLTDLDAWLESKRGNVRSYAEALVIAGLLTKDPDLIRQGIQSDPKNGHLLFIGTTFPAFSDEERLAMSKRLLEAAPDNGLAAFIHASHLLGAGQSEAAIQMLRSSAERTRIDDFGIETQLLMDEAYGAVGLSPGAAKLRSAYNLQMPYLSNMRSFVSSLKEMEGSFTTGEASELQSLTASMGHRLADQSRSGMLLSTLAGFSLEEASLAGVPDETPSPYIGLTVAQARESIVAERQAIQQETVNFPDLQEILSADPALMGRYIDRVRLTGELEAAKWLHRETERAR